jgi:hypothetical protein
MRLPSPSLRARVIAAAAVAVAGGALTITHVAQATSPAPTATAKHDSVPASLLGLRVAREDIAASLAKVHGPQYLHDIRLYSLRDGDLLQATLEIGPFNSGWPVDSPQFQAQIVGQIGGTVQARRVRFGATPVYVTTARGLVMGIWFRGGSMFVLAIRDTYDKPKTLIDAALGVRP